MKYFIFWGEKSGSGGGVFPVGTYLRKFLSSSFSSVCLLNMLCQVLWRDSSIFSLFVMALSPSMMQAVMLSSLDLSILNTLWSSLSRFWIISFTLTFIFSLFSLLSNVFYIFIKEAFIFICFIDAFFIVVVYFEGISGERVN